jgi:hypothetical protein
VKKPTGGFDNGLGAILIGEHSLASFLSKKSPEGISGLFQKAVLPACVARLPQALVFCGVSLPF